MCSKKLDKFSENFRKNNIEVVLAAEKNDALKKTLKVLGNPKSVGLGGSMSVTEIGLLDALRKMDTILYDQYEDGISREESLNRRKEGLSAEIFIAGANALTEDGQIINCDGFGNRVAGMIYGPGKVLLVVGKNKLCKSLEEALDRVRNVAAVKNAKRLKVNTPCVKSGRCEEDKCGEERICNITTVIHRQAKVGRVTIVLVDEDLGF